MDTHGLSARTVRYAHSLLHSAFKDAVKRRLLPHSPVVYAEPPRQERKEIAVFSEKEAKQFLKAATQDELGAVLILALTTGLRPEEYLGLQEKYLHLDRGVVEVQRVLVRVKGGGWELREPKTGRSRRNVTLPPQTVRALVEHRRQQAAAMLKAGPSYQRHGFVFATSTGSPLSDRNLTLGHSSVAFTMDTYTHVLPSMQEAAAERISKLLFG